MVGTRKGADVAYDGTPVPKMQYRIRNCIANQHARSSIAEVYLPSMLCHALQSISIRTYCAVLIGSIFFNVLGTRDPRASRLQVLRVNGALSSQFIATGDGMK